ncbi:MAG: hypothetical protein JJU00_20160 [Opitutales bacterium]|nr:hypothetical protein [Opitutales bacterium]
MKKEPTEKHGGGGAVYLGAFESANLMGMTFLIMNLLLLVLNGTVLHQAQQAVAGDDQPVAAQEEPAQHDKIVRFDASTVRDGEGGFQPVAEVTHRLVRLAGTEAGQAWIIQTDELVPTAPVRFRYIEH